MMNIHIDKTGDFGFVTTKEAFHGRILGRNRREIATIEYDNSTLRAKLLITMGADSIRLSSHGKYLTGTAGDFLINGTKYGRYNHTNLHSLEMSTCAGEMILQVAEDDADRRFLWAYRQGESRGNAKAYSSSKYALLLGRDYALASVLRPMDNPFFFAPDMSFELLNDADEEVFHQRSKEEQLCILVCSCWWLCDQLHHAKSGVDPVAENWRRLSVPSTLCIGNRLTFLPEFLEPRNPRVEFLSTQPVFMWLWLVVALVLGLVILPVCQGGFTSDAVAFVIYSTIIPVSWIEFCRFWNKRAKQRLKHLEEQLNARETEPSFNR